jgi:nitrate/nitrite-specific signal transduction histidine kinase
MLSAVIPLLLLAWVDEQTTEKTLTEHIVPLFMCLAIIIPLFALIIGQSLTNPLNNITKSVTQFTEGNFDHQVEISSSHETAQLAQSLNFMANQLKETFETLEKRVQERDAELLIAIKEAEIANQAKNRFVETIGHDLRSPLNTVLGFSEVMLHTKNLSTEHYENIRLIHSSGKHLLSLINAIVARMDGSEKEIPLTSQDFQVMPSTWLAKLYKAVLEADSEQAMKLIHEMSQTETLLINHLSALVRQFQFERILELIEPLMVEDGKLDNNT